MKTFCIENKHIKREIFIDNGEPLKSVITNKDTNAVWESDGKEPLIAMPGIELKGAEVEIEKNKIRFIGTDFELVWEFRIFENLPVTESRIGLKGKRKINLNITASEGNGVEGIELENSMKDYAEGFGSTSNNVDLHSVEFYDRSDYTNLLVEKRSMPLYNKWGVCKRNGHFFVLKDKISGEECFAVKNSPCADAHINKTGSDFLSAPISNIHMCSSGIDVSLINENEFTYSYPVAIGVCGRDESINKIYDYYSVDYKKTPVYIMSNTWGDRNQDKCVCEDFIMNEIDVAAEIGVDVVQIDDGWQQGITANSAISSGGVWESGFRNALPDFWSVNKEKFPHGFKKIIDYAESKNISIGLWFSPDALNDYEMWQDDARVMIDFYRKFGIRHFKLDGINIGTKAAEENVMKMLELVTGSSDGNIVFNMDITNGKRLGYLLHREYGDLFVENRYTDLGNYYPHNTLRNLWELSQYIPASRLQMEVLNNKRSENLYNDILAPSQYDIDYIFASVMAAKPLMWMELSSLDDDNIKRLKKIIAVYKKYRDDFEKIIPIGDKPSGFSLTGFKILGKKNNYVILLREMSEDDSFGVQVKKILATNDENAETSPAKLTKEKSYLFGII